jgi:mannan endo-1,4-beta-mannosidase
VKASTTCVTPDTHKGNLGVVLYRRWQTTLPQFEKQGGVRPKIFEYYVGFGAPFDLAVLAHVDRSAFPVIQIDPRRAPLQQIIDGRYDSYLISPAKEVARYKCPVAISFAHEMNGDWYPWGSGYVTPAVYIAA